MIAPLERLGVDHLITIGGNGTAHTARSVAEASGAHFTLAHVPKTIDDDLPLPPGGAHVRVRDGARGRSARGGAPHGEWAHELALVRRRDDGAKCGSPRARSGEAAGATLAILPEELDVCAPRLGDVARIVEGAMLKRLAEGRSHGVAVIAEGGAELLPESDFPGGVPRDKQGRPRFTSATSCAESNAFDIASRATSARARPRRCSKVRAG